MTRDEAVDRIRNSPVAEHTDELAKVLQPSVRISVCSGSPSTDLRRSHFGGLPSLPANVSWPVWDKTDHLNAAIQRLEGSSGLSRIIRSPSKQVAALREQIAIQPVPLAFLGQIFPQEIHEITPIPGWPREGSLAFFYDPSQPWGFDPADRGCSKILYFSQSEHLKPIASPPSVESHFNYPSRELEFSCEWCLPSKPERHGCKGIDSNTEAYGQLLEDMIEGGYSRSIHRFGGYPQEVQGEMELECQLVSHGIYCGGPEGYNDPRRAELEKGAADWQLVMQFDSEPDLLHWEWGDMGRLYFWTKKKDILAGNFESCWTILQCY